MSRRCAPECRLSRAAISLSRRERRRRRTFTPRRGTRQNAGGRPLCTVGAFTRRGTATFTPALPRVAVAPRARPRNRLTFHYLCKATGECILFLKAERHTRRLESPDERARGQFNFRVSFHLITVRARAGAQG